MMMGKVVVVGKRVLRRERDWPTASFVLDPQLNTEKKDLNIQSMRRLTLMVGVLKEALKFVTLDREKVECNRCCKFLTQLIPFTKGKKRRFL